MSRMTLNRIPNVINNFKVKGTIKEVVPYGNGHINDTFMVISVEEDGTEHKYILQTVNHFVFKEPDKVMENIQRVTEYLKDKVSEKREVLVLVHTFNDLTYYKDKDGYFWRMYKFVKDSICRDRPNNDEFYECAVAFGRFQKLLSDFPADSLHETIKDFHNTPKRYESFLKSVEENKIGRAENVAEEISFVKDRALFYSVLLDSNKAGKLPIRVSHNDTKSNNVMLDAETHKALCVIDLDTIMAGFSVTDFGDAVRFGASTAAEDEKDLNKVNFDIEKFEIYAKGFLDGCEGSLPDQEIMLLPEGAKMMTIECGMRFLADYLEGDTYFKTSYPDHNLVRARTQFKLVKDMEDNWDTLKTIVKKYCKG